MDDQTLQKLANIATVRNHINNILNAGRGVIPKPDLHKIQAEGTKLDRMFVGALLNSSSQEDANDTTTISNRLAEEKAKLAAKKAPAVITVDDATKAAVVDAKKKLAEDAVQTTIAPTRKISGKKKPVTNAEAE